MSGRIPRTVAERFGSASPRTELSALLPAVGASYAGGRER